MLKAFPRYAIGTALLLTGCQTPAWMAMKRSPEAAPVASAEGAPSSKNPVLSQLKKKPNESAELSIATSIGKGKEHLQAYYQNPSQPKTLEAAEKSFERALLVDPRNAEAHHGLGVCMDLQKRYPAAEEHYRLAIATEPKNATYHADLGYSYFLQKRYPDAEKSLGRALELDPSNALASKNLGMTYARQGKRELAETTFRRVMNDAEVRQAMAQIDGASEANGSDIALASSEQSRAALAKDASWDQVQSRMEEARRDSVRQRETREQQDRASQLGIDPERMRQMQLLQAEQQQAAGRGGAPGGPAMGGDPRGYRGRDPYADMKNQLEALDRSRTNVANGPVYLDQNGFQAVPHQPATYPEAQQTYHPDGPIQPLSGQHVPANAATWSPGAQSPHAAPQGRSLVPPSSAAPGNASPYYQAAPSGQESMPPQYQTGYGAAPAADPSGYPTGYPAGPVNSGQQVMNAYGNRPNWPGAGRDQMSGAPPVGYGPSAPPPPGYGPGNTPPIQQVAAERMAAGGTYADYGSQGGPATGAPPRLPPGGQPNPGFSADPYAALAAPVQQAPRGAGPSAPGQMGYPVPNQAGYPGAGPTGLSAPGGPSPGFETEFEQAKREAAMHGLGVGPGPLFPAQASGSAQPPSMPPGPMGSSATMMPPQGDPRSQPGDGVQLPGVQWNGAQSAPALRQLPTNIQVPDLKQASQPQYESNWDLYRQQVNQLGQQTPAAPSTYLSQNQYSAGSSFNQTPQAPNAPTSLPSVGAMSSYDEERLKLSRMNQQQQEILLRSPSGTVVSPATEQRAYTPVLPSPSDQMIPTWGNQSIVPPAWPSRTESDPNYRARGYDAPPAAATQYDRGEEGSSRGVVTPDRYPSAGQRSTNYGGSQGRDSQSNAGYSSSNGGGLPAIVPASRSSY